MFTVHGKPWNKDSKTRSRLGFFTTTTTTTKSSWYFNVQCKIEKHREPKLLNQGLNTVKCLLLAPTYFEAWHTGYPPTLYTIVSCTILLSPMSNLGLKHSLK